MILIEYKFGAVVGRGIDDLFALGYRYDSRDGFPYGCASFVVRAVPGDLIAFQGSVAFYRGLWESRSGRLFVTDGNDGAVLVSDPGDPQSSPWQRHAVGFAPMGVWGLDDGFVMTWGAHGTTQRMALFDGASWQAMPAPEGVVMAVHGLSRDLVYAVGLEGLMARWDGSRWHSVESPVDVNLSSVHLVSPDEMWACSTHGKLLEGSVHGWSHVLDHDESLFDLVKWRGTLYLAAPFQGLLAFDGKKLVNVKDNALPKALHATEGALLASCDDRIIATTDGSRWMGRFRRDFASIFKGRPPDWAPGVDFEDSEGA